LQRQAREYLAEPTHPVFELVGRDWLTRAAGQDELDMAGRFGIERMLNLAVWLDMYSPVLKLS
jgi:asparagine synthase (glutamine-hydrolysing)